MNREETDGKLVQLILSLIIIFFLVFAGLFVDETVAKRVPETFGFTNVEVIETHRFFVGFRGCGYLDDAQFEVRATNPREQLVIIYVCAGWPFKDATIRVK